MMKLDFRKLLKKLPRVESMSKEDLIKRKKENNRGGWIIMGYTIMLLGVIMAFSLQFLYTKLDLPLGYSFMALGVSGVTLLLHQLHVMTIDSLRIEMELRFRKLEEKCTNQVDHI